MTLSKYTPREVKSCVLPWSSDSMLGHVIKVCSTQDWRELSATYAGFIRTC
jgi:hypothetical protein